MLNNYICALDIGSSKIAAAVAQLKKKHINNIFFDSAPSRAVKCGVIVNSIDLVNSISSLLKNLKVKSGINIKFLYVNISGQNIVAKHSRAIMPLTEKGNKVITAQDLQRVNEQARILGSSLEEEIIHQIPYSYSIDSKRDITNPLGLYSHRLEVDLYLVCAKLSGIQSLNRAINQSGYEIKDLFFSSLATSKVVMSLEHKEGLNLFCDIGSDTTELLVFKNGILNELKILAIGADTLTSRLSEALKIPQDLAEEIKRSYGTICEPQQIGEDRQILVKKNELYNSIKQREVCEIVTSQARLICSDIKDAVCEMVSNYKVNNFVVVGRSILSEGFIETLENTLAMPVKIGHITNTGIPASVKQDSALAGQKYLMYLTNLGIICEALQDKSAGNLSISQPAKNPIVRVVNRFKEVYQEYF